MGRTRLAVAAAAACLTATVGAVGAAPAWAEGALVVAYRCAGGVAGERGVAVRVTMTATVSAGALVVDWALTHPDARRFGSPGRARPGARLDLQGVVRVTGGWNGELRPRGAAEHGGALAPGDRLTLPRGLSDSAGFIRYGKVRLEPAGLTVRFVPASRVTAGRRENPPDHRETTCARDGRRPGAIELNVAGPVASTPGGDRRKPSRTGTAAAKAQVRRTPVGGVATGEAPGPGGVPYLLLVGGSLLLAGSTAGGLLARRGTALRERTQA